MIPSEASQKLSEISDVILNDKLDIQSHEDAIVNLKSLLFGISGLNMNAKVNEHNIQLDNGQAIGPKWAGLCLDDLHRTIRYMRGIHEAVEVKRKSKKSETVTILFAGTGPFATLILLLLSRYSPEELQLVLLEINEISVESLKRIIGGFNAFDYIKEIYQCDASNIKYTTSIKEIDIFLLECMQHALFREPQVAITRNLLPQLPKDEKLTTNDRCITIPLIIAKLNQNDKVKGIKSQYVVNKKPVLFTEFEY